MNPKIVYGVVCKLNKNIFACKASKACNSENLPIWVLKSVYIYPQCIWCQFHYQVNNIFDVVLAWIKVKLPLQAHQNQYVCHLDFFLSKVWNFTYMSWWLMCCSKMSCLAFSMLMSILWSSMEGRRQKPSPGIFSIYHPFLLRYVSKSRLEYSTWVRWFCSRHIENYLCH